jgi:SAM-dependent methyltransferase
VTPSPLIDDGVVIGNVFDKHHSRNPMVRRFMAGFDQGLFRLLDLAGAPSSVLEVGCGEGHVTALLAQRFPAARVLGTDVSAMMVGIARREHPELRFGISSIYDVADLGSWDLVVACGLRAPNDPAALDAICAKNPVKVLITVPREPLWRLLNIARGQYWRSLGNTPGHVRHWSRSALLEFLGRRLEIEDVRTPTPWTQVLGRPRPAVRS